MQSLLQRFKVLVHGIKQGTQGIYYPLQMSANGSVQVDIVTAGGASILDEPGDGKAPVNNGNVPVIGYNELFNGTNFDRQRGNTQETLLASAARTLATTSADFTNFNARGAHVIIDVSAYTSGNLVVTIQGKDPVSGNYYDLLVGATIAATGTTVLKIYPGIGQIANGAASDILPRIWRVSCSAVSATYSVGAVLVV